jgi:hypothetical protein
MGLFYCAKGQRCILSARIRRDVTCYVYAGSLCEQLRGLGHPELAGLQITLVGVVASAELIWEKEDGARQIGL